MKNREKFEKFIETNSSESFLEHDLQSNSSLVTRDKIHCLEHLYSLDDLDSCIQNAETELSTKPDASSYGK